VASCFACRLVREHRFRRGRRVLHWVGVLTSIAGLATVALRLDQDETIVGREKDPSSAKGLC
jgi:hypothetical protein